MERAITLYDLIYRDILTDIYTGKLKDGDRMPSLPELCKKYDIGRNTARSVVQLLADNGFLEHANKKQSFIRFDLEKAEIRQAYLRELARRKRAIADVFESLAVLMPDVAIFCIETCSESERLRLAEMCGEAVSRDIRAEMEIFQRLFEVYQYALSLARNHMMLSLFEAMFQFIQVPLSAAERTSPAFRMTIPMIRVFLRSFKSCIQKNNMAPFKKQLIFFCQSTVRRADSHLCRVCAGLPEVPPSRFFWMAGRDEALLYTSLVSELLKKINTGVYPVGDPIPSYAELAAQYKVSEKTSRRAVAILDRLKIVHIANGKRGRVAPFPVKNPELLLRDPFVTRGLSACFEAVQIMALICRPVVLKLMEELGPKAGAFARDIAENGTTMEALMEPFFYATHSPCIQTVYRQLALAMNWSYLLVFLENENIPFAPAEAKRMQGILREGEPAGIAEGFHEMFLRLFEWMRKYVSRLGFPVDIIVR